LILIFGLLKNNNNLIFIGKKITVIVNDKNCQLIFWC